MRTGLFFVLAAMALVLAADSAQADKLVLVAGGGSESSGPATKAKLIDPFGVDFDAAGNMYIVEMVGERVLRVDPKGILSPFAGIGKKGHTGDGGPAREALFNGMHSVVIHPDGTIYLADTLNNRVRKIDPKSGVISAFAGTGEKGFGGDGGPALKAKFNEAYCIAFDAKGLQMYVTDLGNRRIRAIDMKTGIIDTIAGSGEKGTPKDGADATTSPLVDPRAACVDRQGNIYILERSGNALRVVDPQGKIRTVAGTDKSGYAGDGGDALQATFKSPKHLCVDLDDTVIIADSGNHVIRRYIPKEGKIVRLAGTGKKGMSGDGGEALQVDMNEPHGVYVHSSGALYISDSNNGRVFRLEKGRRMTRQRSRS